MEAIQARTASLECSIRSPLPASLTSNNVNSLRSDRLVRTAGRPHGQRLVTLAKCSNAGHHNQTLNVSRASTDGRPEPPSLLQSALRTSAALLCAGAVALLPVGSALAAECAEKQGLFSDDRLVTLLIVTETIALLGAGVGGTLARQRKEELERMNAQLRQINLSLRKQARTEVYAPSLTYAPPQRAEPVAVAPAAAAAAAPAADAAPPVVNTRAKAMSEKLRLAKQELQTDPKRAVALFTEACAMAVELNDKVAERRATRGIGAAYQRLGEYAKGIEYKKAVLELSKAVGNSIGDADAYGAIADMYAELQDFEQAGKYYDLYIAQLRTDEAED